MILKKISPSYWALGILLTINLLNYLDRQVLYAVLPLIKNDLALSDTRLGSLASAFMVVYMCAAPIVGYLADRSSRKNWIAFGVGCWSLATMGSGLSRSFNQLFLSRAAVGIGESCHGSVSPAFVAEFFPKSRQARVLAIFSAAIPVGSALGYILGGILGKRFGWRSAFYFAGLPGLAMTLLAYRLVDPAPKNDHPSGTAPKFKEYFAIFRNRSFLLSTLSMTAMTFCLGGYAVWFPTFLSRAWGLDVLFTGVLFGVLTVVGGLVGSLAGGWLSDSILPFNSKAYFLVSGAGFLIAFPLALLALKLTWFPGVVLALLAAEICAFLNMGPLNAIIVSVTPLRMRSMAFAVNLFILHALGDAASPILIGIISDRSGLRQALSAASVFLAIAGGFCFWGTRYFDSDASAIEEAAGA